MIPYGKQDINKADIDAVIEVLRSDFLTQGPKVPQFEAVVGSYVGSKYAVAMNSATSALHLACLALGVGEGDRVWTTPITFVASANCVLYCGAKVNFVDIDPLTYNLCPVELETKLIQAKQENKLPKVIVPVHFAGQSCDMRRIHQLSQEYGFKVIEDASHAIGGKYLGKYIGCCEYSDITVFSFHPVKIITTAEGGVATTNQRELSEKMALLRSHGITRDPKLMTKESDGGWYYQQVDLGFNYRMTELQAALGVSQMQRLDDFVAKRHQLQQRYYLLLQDLPITLPYQSSDSYSALHLYPIQLQLEHITKTRTQVFDELKENNIGVNVHYIPVHRQPYYEKVGFKQGDFPEAESYYKRAISLPLYPALSHKQQESVISILKETLK